MLPVRGVLARAAGGQPVGVVDLQGRVVPLVDIIVRVRRARTGVVGVDGSPDPPVEGIVAVVELHEPSTLLPRLTLLDKPAVATARNLPLFLLDRSLLTSVLKMRWPLYNHFGVSNDSFHNPIGLLRESRYVHIEPPQDLDYLIHELPQDPSIFLLSGRFSLVKSQEDREFNVPILCEDRWPPDFRLRNTSLRTDAEDQVEVFGVLAYKPLGGSDPPGQFLADVDLKMVRKRILDTDLDIDLGDVDSHGLKLFQFPIWIIAVAHGKRRPDYWRRRRLE